MASETNQPRRGPSDTADSSSTHPLETAAAAPPGGDYRLWPGGAHGTPVDPGMSSLDHDHDPHPEAAGWIDEQIVGKGEGVKR